MFCKQTHVAMFFFYLYIMLMGHRERTYIFNCTISQNSRLSLSVSLQLQGGDPTS